MHLKMYVWNDFLSDHTPGLACVLAENIEEALMELKIALERDGLGNLFDEALQIVPSIFERPIAVYVAGGG